MRASVRRFDRKRIDRIAATLGKKKPATRGKGAAKPQTARPCTAALASIRSAKP